MRAAICPGFQPYRLPLSPTAPTDLTVPHEKLRLLFALLFSSPEPVSQDRIREVLYVTVPEGEEPVEQLSPRQHIEALETWMAERDLPLLVQRVGKAFRILTNEEVAEDLSSVRKKVHADKLGPAALEVLALVAYRQPILKADIDAIRGVKSGPHLRHLLDLRVIRILGRAELPGRPFLYGTTREFLDRFGLKDLKDLPEAGRLSAPAEAEPVAEATEGPLEPATTHEPDSTESAAEVPSEESLTSEPAPEVESE